ncbi:SufE family protein [Thiorhodovibrio frisius]|uniref:SufE protein probably involved in Fe-S center assembly n=1 Tax=Thiorhodovibrio frisius TaxID=631362 RepID=H8Z5G3_9GAMM|nr:SufE family protein [Thiorhodovibrio frisius]EIC19509.1 SufE protein probably involved in Fe-S center assembly [Thiorhodovibrio frisius]WPL20528.1 Cysteine desulfuration protein SufE [Thiorhodovibrio frisius]
MDTAEVLEAFELLGNWEARYEFIGELSRELLQLADSERTEANLVQGCNTQTWLTGSLVGNDPAVIEFRAVAETPLVRGLVALLLVPFQRQPPATVLATDPTDYIDGLGLKEHLSANRQAGMEHFMERVYSIARGLGGASGRTPG